MLGFAATATHTSLYVILETSVRLLWWPDRTHVRSDPPSASDEAALLTRQETHGPCDAAGWAYALRMGQ